MSWNKAPSVLARSRRWACVVQLWRAKCRMYREALRGLHTHTETAGTLNLRTASSFSETVQGRGKGGALQASNLCALVTGHHPGRGQTPGSYSLPPAPQLSCGSTWTGAHGWVRPARPCRLLIPLTEGGEVGHLRILQCKSGSRWHLEYLRLKILLFFFFFKSELRKVFSIKLFDPSAVPIARG